jgi:RNA polymerase sigma-70 factor, ECF subfamily
MSLKEVIVSQATAMPAVSESKNKLLARLRRREPEALATVVQDHAKPLYRAARGLGFREEEAEDMVQDVFATFLETLDRFEGRSQVRTWLFGILHHKVMERRRDQYRDQQNDPIDEVFESRFDTHGNWMRPPQDLEQLLASQQIGEAIKHCLETLPTTQREVFVLREIEECETGEICKILSISITNLSVPIHRARIRLRECIEARGWRRAG